MDIDKAIYGRHSTRYFSSKPVSDEDLMAILDAGCQAPSSKNDLPWKVMIVRPDRLKRISDEMLVGVDPGSRTDLVEGTFRAMGTAPVCIFIFFCPPDDSRYLAHMQSLGAFMQNMMLKAYSKGLGTLWCGDILFCPEAAMKALGTDQPPVAALLVGYESDRAEKKIHKAPEDIIIGGLDV